MKQVIRPAVRPLTARVTIPGSKSITNRALLLATLANGVSELSDILLSEDTLAFANALRQLGVVVSIDEPARTAIVAGGAGCVPAT